MGKLAKFSQIMEPSFQWEAFFVVTIAGGATEVIAAGNFMDGAITSSTVYLFNHLAHSTSRPARAHRQLKRILKYGEQNGGLRDITAKFYQQLVRTELFFTNARDVFDNVPFTTPGNRMEEKLRFFANMVKTKAPFDIKQLNKGFSAREIGMKAIFEGKIYDYDDFGNINFGYAARVFGIPLWQAVKAAGLYQTFFQGNPDFSNWEGFFDASKDTRNIKFGYNFTPIWAR